ncbi:MAG: hypothetical protein WCB12_01885 [Bryobacteraceae bacterium]
MRVWILIALLPGALLAQTSPPRPADQNGFEKLPQRLDWLQPGAHSPQGAWRMPGFASPGLVLHDGNPALAMLPKVCSIPLLRVPMAKGSIDRMSVPTPPGKAIDPKFILPIPPVCEDWKR